MPWVPGDTTRSSPERAAYPSIPRQAPPSSRIQTKHRASCPMNGMGGIEQRVGSPFQGVGVLFVPVPGVLPRAGVLRPVGALLEQEEIRATIRLPGRCQGRAVYHVGASRPDLGSLFRHGVSRRPPRRSTLASPHRAYLSAPQVRRCLFRNAIVRSQASVAAVSS